MSRRKCSYPKSFVVVIADENDKKMRFHVEYVQIEEHEYELQVNSARYIDDNSKVSDTTIDTYMTSIDMECMEQIQNFDPYDDGDMAYDLWAGK